MSLENSQISCRDNCLSPAYIWDLGSVFVRWGIEDGDSHSMHTKCTFLYKGISPVSLLVFRGKGDRYLCQ